MKVVKGNKIEEVSRKDLVNLISRYENVHVDLGTGDGRYVYKSSVKNPKNFYIGVDPSKKQLEVYSKKAIKKGIKNALFVLGSFELFPTELFKIANSVSIILPWGTLLQSVVMANEENVRKIKKLLNKKGTLEILFGYSQKVEQTEIKRLGLDKLDNDYVSDNIVSKFVKEGFKVEFTEKIKKHNLKNIESTWSKKLVFGQDRPIYHLKLRLT